MRTPFFSLLLLFTAALAQAEPYSKRLDVLSPKLNPKAASENVLNGIPKLNPADWENFKTGSLRFLAQMQALYPKDDLYFLARDGEYLYDAMKVLAQDDPALLKRIKLVNVSTALSKTGQMRPYLIQEGLTKEQLQGRGVVLIDTCCGASIPDRIREAFPELKGQLRSHFLTSSGKFTPSSRVFAEAYTPRVMETLGHDIGLKIENFPHYTNSAVFFGKDADKLIPVSTQPATEDQKRHSRALMADLKAHFSDPETKKEFASLTKTMRDVTGFALGKKEMSETAIRSALKTLALNGALNFVNDLRDAEQKGNLELPNFDSLNQHASHVKVKPLDKLNTEDQLAVRKLMKDHPMFRGLIIDPEGVISKFTPADMELLHKAVDVGNYQLSGHLRQHVNTDPAWKQNDEARGRMFERFVDTNGLDLNQLLMEISHDEKLAAHFGNQPEALAVLVELLKNKIVTPEHLFENFLGKDRLAGSENAIKTLEYVVKRNPDEISKISEEIFTKPNSWFKVGKSEFLVSHLIKNADESDLKDLATLVFSEPEWMEKHGDTLFPKLLKEIAKKVQDGTWKKAFGKKGVAELAMAAEAEAWQKNAAFQNLCKGRPFGAECFEKTATKVAAKAADSKMASAKPGLAKDFLKSNVRPVVADVLQSEAAVKKVIEGVPLPAKLQDEKGLYKIYEEVLAEVLQKNPDHKLVFLARDSELLFDGLQTLIENHPQKELIKDRVVLMNLSRPLAQSSDINQLRTYFDAHGISLDDMVHGDGKYLFFDTGNRGSIFLQVLDKAIAEIPPGAGRADKIKNLLKNMNVLLMGSERPKSTLKNVLPQITDIMPSWQISQILRTQLYFEEALDGKAQKLGMPSDPLTKRRWIADRVEYLPHWTGRATRLSSSGSSIELFETPPTDLERKQALLLQVRAMEHFKQPEVAKKFDKLLTKFAEAGAGKDAVILAEEKEKPAKKLAAEKAPVVAEPEAPKAAPAAAQLEVVPAKPAPKAPNPFAGYPAVEATNLAAMQKLQPKQIIETESGARYRIEKEVDVGKRGKVYRAFDANGKHVAIKVPKNFDADTLASIIEETEKVAKLKEHGLPHAAIREASDTVVVKDWVEGVRADAFMKQWEQNGKDPNAPEIKKLAELLDGAASKNVYVGDLNPKNLIWTNGEWIIVDSGGIDEGKAKDVALKRYLEKIPRRWSKYAGNPASCSTMFTQALQKQLTP